ncbi:alpha/beta hydrolase [Microbacterium sp. Marseille-Q6965]|uniref:alpha/beta hydrolase n=1 Tax=Microbacterium sp. Marseille-Q6965 TaxID=2965072 RepID=UPI0021B7129D|nr:alpha/beta hydrolase [Microbacterium sp. Marseille-Q6965]
MPTSHRTRKAAVASAVVTGLVFTAAPAVADEGDRVLEGTLADSTPYRFVVPDDWNGTVFIDMDFAAGRVGAAPQALIDEGAAYGGTTRTVTGWNIGGAIANQIEALDVFSDTVGEPALAITMGNSMGGFVAAATGELHPDRIDGVVAACGGLSGTVSQWNQKLDTVFVLSELLDPEGTLPVVDIPADVPGAQQAWIDHLSAAQTTPEGRARIALAAAVGQLPAWSQEIADPDPRDPASYQAAWFGALAGDPLPYIGQAMSSRRTSTQIFGGLPSWNTGIDYVEQLRKASPEARRVVADLYAQAGLSLEEDLAAVNAADRYEADPEAVARFAAAYEFTGDISVPTVTLNNVGDQISTVAQQSAYEERVKKAGNASLLRQTYVASAGHCAFSAAETVAAAHLLLNRLESGRWGGAATAAQMNEAAESLDLGAARFIRFQPDRFNRG